MFFETSMLLWQVALGFIAICLVFATAGTMRSAIKVGGADGKVVFYMRYSSHNQRGDSIDDQRRNIIKYLDQQEIAHDDHLELTDEAVSGMITNRKGFRELIAMVEREEVGMVVVDDLSRLTRGKDLGILWDTLAVHRCRLISVIDGIDSTRESDEVGAMVKGLMNNITNRMNGRRIYRGIVGRVLDGNGSYGSHCFGYYSEFSCPEEAAKYKGIGPKPKKVVKINQQEAAIVLEVFQRYGEGVASLTEIARDLNNRSIPMGSRSSRKGLDGIARYHTGWHKARISKMLAQCKYIGDWRWGEYTHTKTPSGKRISRPADAANVIVVKRPDLAIVPKELWHKVQVRLSENRELYGFIHGQKKRGAKRHYTEEYPGDLVGGLLFCGSCGSRLHFCASGSSGYYYRCPVALNNAKHKGTTECHQRGWVHREKATAALMGFLKKELTREATWIDGVYKDAVQEFRRQLANTPDELKLNQDRFGEITRAIDKITHAIETGGGDGVSTLVKRLKDLEAEGSALQSMISRLNSKTDRLQPLPSIAWVKEKIKNLAGVLGDDSRAAAKLLRECFGKVMAHSLVAPGKKRGAMELRFRFDHHGLVNEVLAGYTLGRHACEEGENGNSGEEYTIYLGGNDKLDKLMPAIATMVNDGKTWAEIGQEFGISKGWANKAYRRWKEAANNDPLMEEEQINLDSSVADNVFDATSPLPSDDDIHSSRSLTP